MRASSLATTPTCQRDLPSSPPSIDERERERERRAALSLRLWVTDGIIRMQGELCLCVFACGKQGGRQAMERRDGGTIKGMRDAKHTSPCERVRSQAESQSTGSVGEREKARR